jgi:UDP-N-acetylmuramate--alanine ligase
MALLDNSDRRPVHFIGIAGAGMSALAELFVRRGVAVTGCDASAEGAPDLRRLGVPVQVGHDPLHLEGARAVVVSSAIPKTHPELVRAREAGLPVIRRAEALGEAVNDGELIAIAGTHGKTTTTVMTTDALSAAGLAPTGLAGGRVGAWDGNLRHGSATRFVVEADEYDRSFLALRPTVGVVTNVEADHLDIYAGLADIRRAFEQFLAPARAIALCDDDPGARALRLPSGAEVMRYGIHSRDARLLALDVRMEGNGSLFEVELDDEMLGEVELRVPGAHNVLNALAAIAAGLLVGTTLERMRPGLEMFTGVERRFQRLGVARGVAVVDDYAHHPTEIRATLDAARAAYPGRRVVAAFQPHLFTRTRDFATDFGRALARADVVYLTEIYPAREAPIPGVTAELIADAIRTSGGGGSIAWRGERTALADALAAGVHDGDVVLTLGAGDITRTGPELLRLLSSVIPR